MVKRLLVLPQFGMTPADRVERISLPRLIAAPVVQAEALPGLANGFEVASFAVECHAQPQVHMSLTGRII